VGWRRCCKRRIGMPHLHCCTCKVAGRLVSPWSPGVALVSPWSPWSPWSPGVALVSPWSPGVALVAWCRPGFALVALVANKIDTLSGPAYKRAMPDKPGRTN